MNPQEFLYEGYVEGVQFFLDEFDKRGKKGKKLLTLKLLGDKNSLVYGSLIDGVFDGNISLSDGNSYTVKCKKKENMARFKIQVEKLSKYYYSSPFTTHSFMFHNNTVRFSLFYWSTNMIYRVTMHLLLISWQKTA